MGGAIGGEGKGGEGEGGGGEGGGGDGGAVVVLPPPTAPWCVDNGVCGGLYGGLEEAGGDGGGEGGGGEGGGGEGGGGEGEGGGGEGGGGEGEGGGGEGEPSLTEPEPLSSACLRSAPRPPYACAHRGKQGVLVRPKPEPNPNRRPAGLPQIMDSVEGRYRLRYRLSPRSCWPNQSSLRSTWPQWPRDPCQ